MSQPSSSSARRSLLERIPRPIWRLLKIDQMLAALEEDERMGRQSIARQMPFQRMMPTQFRKYSNLMFAMWGRNIWFGLVVQVLLGLLLLYLIFRNNLQYLDGWTWALLPLLLGLGCLIGWSVGRKVPLQWSAIGGSFGLAGMWRMMFTMMPIFILRWGLLALSRNGVTAVEPLRHVLFFIVPGMLTTRAMTIIIRLRWLQKAFQKERAAVLPGDGFSQSVPQGND